MTLDWGLAAAGPLSRSFVSRVPKLARHLGPIASTSFRLAARLSHSLRAGTPVRDFADLQDAGFVIVCFPGGPAASLIKLDSLDWARKIVLSCDTPDDPLLAAELRQRGAVFASMNLVSNLSDQYSIVGDRAAVRFAKTLARSLNGIAFEIPQDRLLLFQCALTLSGSFFTPLLESVSECLRQSGLEAKEASRLAESLFEQSLRTFKHAGRKSWSGPVALADVPAVFSQEQALQVMNPLMASYFREAARYSFELYQTFPELTRYNRARWKDFQKRYTVF